MVLVDSSAWIDFFAKGASPTKEKLTSLVAVSDEVVICGLVLQEVLQGFKLEEEFKEAQSALLKFPLIEPDRSTYLQASRFYRQLKKQGITVHSIDVLLASLAIQWNASLLTLDRDFEVLRDSVGLKLFS